MLNLTLSIDFKLLCMLHVGTFAIFAACKKMQVAKRSYWCTYRWTRRKRNWNEDENKSTSHTSWGNGEGKHERSKISITLNYRFSFTCRKKMGRTGESKLIYESWSSMHPYIEFGNVIKTLQVWTRSRVTYQLKCDLNNTLPLFKSRDHCKDLIYPSCLH